MAISISKTVKINRPAGEVFDHLSDFQMMAQFGSGVSELKHVGGPKIGKGAKFQTSGKIWGRKVEGKMEVVHFDKPKAITIKGIFAHVPYDDRITLKPAGDSTELTLADTSSPPGFFKTFSFIYKPILAFYINKDLNRLKRFLESKTS